MEILNSVLNFISEVNIKTIVAHTEKITDLYFKPVKIWKKILSNQKQSATDFTFYIIAYGLILYLFSPDLHYVLKFILLQLLANLQPFLIVFIPFLFFRWLYKRDVKANRLFRITFIYSLQVFPFVFFPMLIAQKYGVESPYIIVENSVFLSEILLIIVVPLLMQISILKKVIWILTNYLFMILFFLFAGYIYNNIPDVELVRSKIEWESPMREFLEFEDNYKDSDLYMSDIFYIIYYKNSNGKKEVVPQFATLNLLDKLAENQSHILYNAKIKTNRLVYDNDTTGARITSIKSNSIYSDSVKIHVKINSDELFSKKTFDSLRVIYDKTFYYDLKYTDSLKAYAKFKENRKLFGLFHDYLLIFDSIYKSPSFVKKISQYTDSSKKVYTDNHGVILVYDLVKTKNNGLIRNKKLKLINQYDKVSNTFRNYFIIKKYLYFPLYFFGKEPNKIEDKFKYIKF
jgi:hypothetical protein